MGANLNLIRLWPMAEAGLDLESNPANTTMDTERLRQDLGLEPLSIRWTIENIFMNCLPVTAHPNAMRMED